MKRFNSFATLPLIIALLFWMGPSWGLAVDALFLLLSNNQDVSWCSNRMWHLSLLKHRHFPAKHSTTTLRRRIPRYSSVEGGSDTNEEESKSNLELELEDLQNRLALIEALEERNKAQIESFVDEQDQWESLEPEEQELLQSKQDTIDRMELLAEQLVLGWMGQKSLEG